MRTIRIFLSSPGDVAAERGAVRELLLGLARGPFVRGRVHIDVVSWDDPHAPAPMDARLTPQEAVNQGLPRPDECDLTVALFWGRMGTPLQVQRHDGRPFLSGTQWECETALQAGKPVLIYRRTEKLLLDPDDLNFEDRLEQKRKVDAFFAEFETNTGVIKRASAFYDNEASLLTRVRQDVEAFIKRFLDDVVSSADIADGDGASGVNKQPFAAAASPAPVPPFFSASSPRLDSLSTRHARTEITTGSVDRLQRAVIHTFYVSLLPIATWIAVGLYMESADRETTILVLVFFSVASGLLQFWVGRHEVRSQHVSIELLTLTFTPFATIVGVVACLFYIPYTLLTTQVLLAAVTGAVLGWSSLTRLGKFRGDNALSTMALTLAVGATWLISALIVNRTVVSAVHDYTGSQYGGGTLFRNFHGTWDAQLSADLAMTPQGRGPFVTSTLLMSISIALMLWAGRRRVFLSPEHRML